MKSQAVGLAILQPQFLASVLKLVEPREIIHHSHGVFLKRLAALERQSLAARKRPALAEFVAAH